MNTIRGYPIKFVSLQTGLKPYLIRSWEGRYKAVCPRRSSNNRRAFSDADIARLRLLRQAVEAGHSISQIAQLGDRALHRLVLQANPTAPFARVSVSGDSSPNEGSAEKTGEAFVESALRQVLLLDTPALESVLGRAAVELPRQAFLKWVILPLFERVGEMWQAGQLKAVSEHLLSVVVRSMLWDMLRTAVTPNSAPRIVVATPAGHWHEIGALASALVAAESGWETNYFGPNLPSDEIAFAVKKVDARAVALGICHGLNDHRLSIELRNLRRLVGQEIPIFIGGSGALALKPVADRIHVLVCLDVDSFRACLDKGGRSPLSNRRFRKKKPAPS